MQLGMHLTVKPYGTIFVAFIAFESRSQSEVELVVYMSSPVVFKYLFFAKSHCIQRCFSPGDLVAGCFLMRMDVMLPDVPVANIFEVKRWSADRFGAHE